MSDSKNTQPDSSSRNEGNGPESSSVPTPERAAEPGSIPNSSTARPADRGPLPLRFRDQVFFAVACAVALVFLGAYCLRTSHWGAEPIELDRQAKHELDFKIELNSATWVEWSQLPGIGSVLAHRIVEDREQRGPFRDVEDLDRVKGIGSKKIDALRAFVRVDPGNLLPRPPDSREPERNADRR